MTTITSIDSTSSTLLWAGRVLSALVILFLVFDGMIKVMQLEIATKTTADLGYPVSVVYGLGILTLVLAVLYAIPRTCVLGAILLTGLLGGAIATHLRVGSPVFTHMLFPVYLGLAAWGGLLLRNERIRAVVLPWVNGRQVPK